MTDEVPVAAEPLDRAHQHALRWLASLADRDVPPGANAAEVADRLGRDLPDGPTDAATVVDLLGQLTDAAAASPGVRDTARAAMTAVKRGVLIYNSV